MRKLYLASRGKISQESQASLINLLEQLLAGTLGFDEDVKLLEYIFCSAKDLYQAGLPEWIQDLDKYIPGLDDETAARPAGMIQSSQVAIIQDPDPGDMDERGYWIDKDPLSILSGYNQEKNIDIGKIEDGVLTVSKPDFLRVAHSQISERIKTFLAIQAVMEAISKVIGVNFTEDIEDWYKGLENHIKLYNALLTPKIKYLGLPHYLGMPVLATLKIGRLKPTAKSIKYYKDRMAIALGGNWWNEAIQSLEFEAEEKDSLAQQMIADIKEAKKTIYPEEASDGQED